MSFELPRGFRFAGVECGIKSAGRDLGLIVADRDCVASGVYTQNIVRAACIDLNRDITPTAKCRAIVVNSGNANACTGQTGKANCIRTAQHVATELGCDPDQILVLSTGVIGQQLPMEKLHVGVQTAQRQLSATVASFESLADAFMTTDKFRKTQTRSFETGDGQIRLAGIAKGAGMIGPNMATMLSVIITDARLDPRQSQQMLQTAVDMSFNRISVDGHTSTNDAVILLSSGDQELAPTDQEQFENFLQDICLELAKMIPTDGEGASRLIDICVTGAKSDLDADSIARTIAMSNLVKTAVHGCDPNWGRIVSAAGYSGVDMELNSIHLKINGIKVFEAGSPAAFDEMAASDSMSQSEVVLIELNVGPGNGMSRHWTSDLTKEYVELNSEYRT